MSAAPHAGWGVAENVGVAGLGAASLDFVSLRLMLLSDELRNSHGPARAPGPDHTLNGSWNT